MVAPKMATLSLVFIVPTTVPQGTYLSRWFEKEVLEFTPLEYMEITAQR